MNNAFLSLPDPAREAFFRQRLPVDFKGAAEQRCTLLDCRASRPCSDQEVQVRLKNLWLEQRRPSPFEILETLSTIPKLRFLFEELAPPQGYSNYTHTYAVLNQRLKYFPDFPGPDHEFTPVVFDVLLALHDIGKFLPKKPEVNSTVEVIKALAELLPLNESELQAIIGLVREDPIGRYLQSCLVRPRRETILKLRDQFRQGTLSISSLKDSLIEFSDMQEIDWKRALTAAQTTAVLIRQLAIESGLSLDGYYSALIRYFQCDTTSYSIDGCTPSGSRCMPSLEYMYLFRREAYITSNPLDQYIEVDGDSGLLKFSSNVRDLMHLLEAAL